jgi:hypothetical protein
MNDVTVQYVSKQLGVAALHASSGVIILRNNNFIPKVLICLIASRIKKRTAPRFQHKFNRLNDHILDYMAGAVPEIMDDSL